MVNKKLDKDRKRALMDARNMIEAVAKMDGNEAETRRRVERIFESLMGYDALEHLSRERAVKGAGETEHVDFAIQLEKGEDSKPVIMVELKRVNVDLKLKHLNQVSSYAINAGCEWILLTNGRDWRLYHVEFGQPPVTQLLEQWDLLKDDLVDISDMFELVSYKVVKKGGLLELWQKTKVLAANNLLAAMFSHDSIKVMRKALRNSTGVMVAPEDIFSGMRRMLNEAAAIELDSLKLSPTPPKRKSSSKKKAEANERSEDNNISSTSVEATSETSSEPTVEETSED